MANYKITALTLQKRNRQRVNVYLDGKFAFGLTRIVAAWLQIGQEIDDEKVNQLKGEDAREVAYQRTLKFLSYRPRSEAEVRQNLNSHKISAENVDYVIDRLKLSGLLNDESFAQVWIENRAGMRPRSQRALAYELRQRGIDDEIIEQALEDVDDDELAYQAALKRAARFQNLEWQDFRKKLYNYLSQRGFNYEASSLAVQRVWDEMQDKPYLASDHSPKEEEIP